MSCSCGGKCGPIILTPEFVLPDQSPGDITVEVTDHELEILCDPAGPFLRRYSVDPDGNVTTIDTELDGVTGYTPTPPVGVCGPDDVDESPGELMSQQVLTLCDDGQPFVRTYTLTDGEITGFTDSDLSGADYTVTGTVGVCPLDVDDESPAECADSEVLILCDVQPDGSSVTFLRRIVTDCDGDVDSVTDSTIAGDVEYTPTGDVGVCPTVVEPLELVEACDDVNGDGSEIVDYVIVYRLDPTGATDPTPIGTYEPDLSAPYTPVNPGPCLPCPDPVIPPEGEPVATDSPERCPRPPGSPTTALPGSAQTLWDGGTFTVPADPDASAGNGTAVNRSMVAFLQADRPMCDNGQVEVSVSVEVCNTSTNATVGYAGAICGYTGNCADELLPHSFLDAPVGPGECQTLTTTWVLPAAELEEGNLQVELDVQTFGPGGGIDWELSDFQAEYTFMTDGCADPENGLGCCEEDVQKVALCEPITIRQNENEQRCSAVITNERCDDTTGDGIGDTCYTELLCVSPSGTIRLLHTYQDTPMGLYTPTNPVPCTRETVETIPLSQLPPAGSYGTGTPSSGTLPSGIGYEVNTGAWSTDGVGNWRFDRTIPVAEQTMLWTFTEPVALRFGITNVNVADECVELSPGVVPESISPSHVWDAATSTLCTNPGQGDIAAVSTFTLADTSELSMLAVDNGENPNAGRGYAFIEVVVSERCCGCDTGSGSDTPPADVVTCGLPPDAVTSGEANSGDDGELQVVDDPEPPPRDGPYTGQSNHVWLPGGGQALWDGGTLVFPEDTTPEPPDGCCMYRMVAAELIAERPACDDGTAQVTVSVDATLDGPNPGVALYYGGLRLYNSRTEEWIAQVPVAPRGAKPDPGYATTMTLTEKVAASDLAAGNILVWLALETFETQGGNPGIPGTGPKQWTTSNFVASYAYATDGCIEEAPSMNVRLCEPITVKYEVPPAADINVTTRSVIEVCKCDDVLGDGTEIVKYTELWEVGGGDPPIPVGAFADGDPSEPYEPTNPVLCPPDETGAAQLSTGIRRLTGAATEDVAAVGSLQSATVTVVTGQAEVTTGDGTVTVPAGISLTWSVQKDDDLELDVLSVTTGAGDDALVHFTVRP